jgi:hypothetical protein
VDARAGSLGITLAPSTAFSAEAYAHDMGLAGANANDELKLNLGRAVQVDPIKPKLKPPGTKRLKLNCDVLLSTSAFKFNLRRYT